GGGGGWVGGGGGGGLGVRGGGRPRKCPRLAPPAPLPAPPPHRPPAVPALLTSGCRLRREDVSRFPWVLLRPAVLEAANQRRATRMVQTPCSAPSASASGNAARWPPRVEGDCQIADLGVERRLSRQRIGHPFR